MHRLESVREGKLRAACDRCHDLKNRCLRTGGIDSRCDRCERLDIDCVYRNTSRIGRPRTLRRLSENFPNQDESREPGHRRRPSKTSLDVSAPRSASGPGSGFESAIGTTSSGSTNQAEAEACVSTALMGSPSDVMSLLVSPEAVHQHADMDWSLDFSHHIHEGIPEPPLHSIYPDVPRPLPSPEATISLPDSGGVSNAEQTTEKLLQLQGQLHRLLWASDKDPAPDTVEQSLEVIKALLEVLQAALAAQGRLPADSGVPPTRAGWPAGNSSSSGDITAAASETNSSSSTAAPSPRQSNSPVANYITAQQALTCYSYMLLLLDRVIGVLTSSDHHGSAAGSNGGVDGLGGSGESSSLSSTRTSSISLGFFSLASQPALNAEVVLHLVLRMVQRLRVLIQVLVSDPGGAGEGRSLSLSSSSSSIGAPPALLEGPLSSSRERLSAGSLSAPSIAVTSHAVADLVSERERLLLERLSYLTGSFQIGR